MLNSCLQPKLPTLNQVCFSNYHFLILETVGLKIEMACFPLVFMQVEVTLLLVFNIALCRCCYHLNTCNLEVGCGFSFKTYSSVNSQNSHAFLLRVAEA